MAQSWGRWGGNEEARCLLKASDSAAYSGGTLAGSGKASAPVTLSSLRVDGPCGEVSLKSSKSENSSPDPSTTSGLQSANGVPGQTLLPILAVSTGLKPGIAVHWDGG